MKADASKRKQMRKAGAPSTKNIDKQHFIEKYDACIPCVLNTSIARVYCGTCWVVMGDMVNARARHR